MKKNLVKNITDFPIDYYTGEPHLELYGNSECVVDGLKSIIEYKKDKIKLNIGKKEVTFLGEDLQINELSTEGAIVKGFIMSVEFSDVC